MQLLRHRTVDWRALLLTGLVLSCDDGIGPLQAGRTVIITSGEARELTVVDGSNGRVAGRVELRDAVLVAALSPDSSTLYLSEGRTSPGDLAAIDMRGPRLLWNEPQSTAPDGRPDRWGGVIIAGSAAIAASPDRAHLFFSRAFRGDTQGVAVLDSKTRDIVTFLGPMAVEARGLVTLLPGPAAPQGAILIVGRRNEYDFPRVDWLYTVDLATLTIRDSAAIVDVKSGNSRYLQLPRVGPDRRHVYIGGVSGEEGGNLYCYDLVAGQVVASTPLENARAFDISPNGETVFLASSGVPGSASSQLLIYDRSLNFREAIELPDVDGMPPYVSGLGISPDGRLVYVASGTGSIVPDPLPVQPGWLTVVDPSAAKVDWTLPLGIWAPTQVFVH